MLGDLLVDKPSETDGYETVVVVDGVPIVEPERLEKLQSVIEKLFGKPGSIVNKYYPQNEETKKTKGFVFFEYSDPQSALQAVKTLNNYKIDKVHTLKVNLVTDFKKYENIPDVWEPPKPQPFKASTDLHSHLLDPDAYDQFCIVAGNAGNALVQVWQNCQPEPVIVEDRPVSIVFQCFY